LKKTIFAVAFLMSGCVASTGNYFAPTAAVICSGSSGCFKLPESNVTEPLSIIAQDPASSRDFHGPQGPANRLDAERKILSGLIRQELVRKGAVSLGLRVSNKDIDDQMASIRARFGGQKGLENNLKTRGLSAKELRSYLINQKLISLIGRDLTKSQKPASAEVESIYKQNKASFDQQSKVAHILVCEKQDPASGQCVENPADDTLAAEIVRRAKGGEDFGALVKQFSKDPTTAARGGEVGYVTPGSSSTPFEKAALGLTETGQVSDPVRSPLGVHVIKLLEKGKTLDQARPDIEQQITADQATKAFRDWLSGLLAKAKITVNPRLGRFDRTSLQVVPLKIQIPPTLPGGPRGVPGQVPVPQGGGAGQPSRGGQGGQGGGAGSGSTGQGEGGGAVQPPASGQEAPADAPPTAP